MCNLLKIVNKKTALWAMLSLLFFSMAKAQTSSVRVPFTPRKSSAVDAPFKDVSTYTIKGDFTMIGNTNLTLDSYGKDKNNSNNKMKFVDIDGDSNTKNSSSATLVIKNYDKDCRPIIFAGLYWTGRGEKDGSASNTIGGLSKKNIKLKKDGQVYQPYTAKDTDIRFPGDNYMYAAYVDVTAYVRQHGTGSYTVADIATKEGDGGGTGYYGGWGMVVIYEDQDMPWRDITVFDGYAYMVGSAKDNATLKVDGFKAAQSGNVGVKLGMMAGEGDVGISGDYFEIQRTSGGYDRLKHSGNKTDNFFNSSINTGSNARNPDHTNNTGIDISIFDVDNKNNQYIPNNGTSVNLRYGSTQDTYIIFNIVIAIDAFVPEVQGHNELLTKTVTDGGKVKPNDLLDFELKIYNKGTDVIKNGKIEIPIPPNAHYVGATPGIMSGTTVQWVHPNSTDASKTPGGKIVWTLRDIPTSVKDINKVLASLKYTIRITNDCSLLTATSGSCGLEVPVNGTITGKGEKSGRDVLEGLIKDYTNDKCKGPDYGGFLATIEVSDQFVDGCPFEVQDGSRLFQPFCELPNNKLPRAEVTSQYPAGTVFYTIPPGQTGHAGSVVRGDFDVSVEGNSYYAVVAGMQEGCYLKIMAKLDIVTSKPTVQVTGQDFCFAQDVKLNTTLSAEGQANGHSIHYFETANSNTPMTTTPAPTTVGKHKFYAAEGKQKDGVWCYGPKVEFTIEILALPVLQGQIDDFYVCIDEGKTVVVADATIGTGNTIKGWQYEKDGEWHDLLETSFQGMLKGNGNNLTVTDADDEVLDQLKVRAIIDNKRCVGYSEPVTIEVRYCTIPVNPMIRSKTNKTI